MNPTDRIVSFNFEVRLELRRIGAPRKEFVMLNNRRQSGRVDFSGVDCDLGTIINISAGGMVVQGRPPDVLRKEVQFGEDEDTFTVNVEHIWEQKIGFRKHIIGYRFVDPPEDLLHRLCGSKLPTAIPRVI